MINVKQIWAASPGQNYNLWSARDSKHHGVVGFGYTTSEALRNLDRDRRGRSRRVVRFWRRQWFFYKGLR